MTMLFSKKINKLPKHKHLKLSPMISHLCSADNGRAHSPACLNRDKEPVLSIHQFQCPDKYSWKDMGWSKSTFQRNFGNNLKMMDSYLCECMRRKQLCMTLLVIGHLSNHNKFISEFVLICPWHRANNGDISMLYVMHTMGDPSLHSVPRLS